MARLDLPEVYDKAPDRYEVAAGYARANAGRRSRWTAVLVIAAVVLALSLAALGLIALSYFQGQHKYSQLALNADTEAALSEPGSSALSGMTVDWEALFAINPDTVAWLVIPGTRVDYPVVRGTDNEYYLTHDFEGDQGWLANFGAVFMDWRNVPDWSDEAYFLYGHHMNDGSMFADIAGMADQRRFDASREVYVLSPRGSFLLRTFALVHCPADEALVQVDFASRQEMAAYVQDKMNRSVVFAGQVPEADRIEKLFAFSTCDDGSSGRYVLYAYVEEESGAGLPETDRGGQAPLSDLT